MKTLSPWKISYDFFDPQTEGLRETLCTLGNGYFATRGAAPEVQASRYHYPGTYVAGLYNKLSTHLAGETVTNEDLVNCPNWLFMTFRVNNGEWFYPSTANIRSFLQILDFHNGILYRRCVFKNRKGEQTLIESNRIVHMAEPHLGAMKYTLTPLNYSGLITVNTILDGSIINSGVERYRQLKSRHWKPITLGTINKNGMFLSMITNQSRIELTQATTIKLFSKDKELKVNIKNLIKERKIVGILGQQVKFFVNKKQAYHLEKTVAIYTSKDGVKDHIQEACKKVHNSPRFDILLRSHKRAWKKLWNRVDIQIEGDTFSQKVIRFHMFHLLQSASLNNCEIDAGLPARGWHGEAYRGHIFWDNLFSMPFFNLHLPEISKSLLLYRYRRLPQAIKNASQNGYQGAMFPWQSGSTGEEETQTLHLNPLSGEWGPDYSCLQRHVSFAIFYNFYEYWNVTGDSIFLAKYGAEVMLSIAQFAASLAKYDTNDKRYHTEGIMGPDEFHEMLPRSQKPGLRDNAYSNLFIVWILLKSRKLLGILAPEERERIVKKIKLKKEDIDHWNDIIKKMSLIINKQGIISQFEGYLALKELNWSYYKKKYRRINRMDRILKAEGKSPDEFKVAKQADVLMIFFVFTFAEVREMMTNMGYRLSLKMMRKNYDYYIKRTSHGSTLSMVVHCFLSQKIRKYKEAWSFFMEVLDSDIYDIQGGTTAEGIHTGVMSGSIDIVLTAFAGINTRGKKLRIDPRLPKNWKSIKTHFIYRGNWIFYHLKGEKLTLAIEKKARKTSFIPLKVRGKAYDLMPGQILRVNIKNAK
ncbi:MAG: glycoside hydrolase family 65 protein [Spirochaetes bacterium]|nr:glycoside hydrolase family 65 protein [Spirochaetota bacterium]